MYISLLKFSLSTKNYVSILLTPGLAGDTVKLAICGHLSAGRGKQFVLTTCLPLGMVSDGTGLSGHNCISRAARRAPP